MKLGTENRATTIVALVLMVLAAFLVFRMFFSGGQPAAEASAPQPAAPAALPPAVRGRRIIRGTRVARPPQAESSLDPRLRLDMLKLSEDTEYKGAGRNIFRAEAEIPKPVAPAIVPAKTPDKNDTQAINTTPQPPPPPPINLKFFGFASGKGEQTSVFLGNGDDVFVAHEGEVVNRRYKVVKIHPTSVEIEDLLSNNRQTIPLTAG